MVWNQKLCIFSKSNQVEIQAKYQCQQRVSHFDHKNSPTSIPEKNYLHDTKCVVCRDRGPVSDITLTCLWHGDSWHRQNVLHGIRGLTISYMSFLDTQCFSVPPSPSQIQELKSWYREGFGDVRVTKYHLICPRLTVGYLFGQRDRPMKNHPVNFCCNYFLSKSGEHFKGTSELYIHSHWDMDGKRTNHQSQGLPNNWQEMFQLAASQSGEALRLAKATFWAWAPMERPAAPTTMAWPILPSEAQATQIGCSTTPSPTPFESSDS